MHFQTDYLIIDCIIQNVLKQKYQARLKPWAKLPPHQNQISPLCQQTTSIAIAATCEVLLRKGSNHQDGFCTNLFERGCLRAMLGNIALSQKHSRQSADDYSVDELVMKAWRCGLLSAPRTCNSEDAPQAAKQGLCSKNVNDYAEVQLLSQNWKSAFVLSWMMQIIYSELLEVPSTIKTGVLFLTKMSISMTKQTEWITEN